MDGVDVPASPGVYFLVGGRRQLLYVGKAADLRRRLADHRRSGRWTDVVDVRWELHPSARAAELREADVLLALRPPRNKAHIDDHFAFVRATPRGLELGRDGDYGCFPQLGTGAGSLTGRMCIDGYNALARIACRAEPASLHELLSGRRDDLRIDLDGEQPHVAHGVRRDRALASDFFVAGPSAMRALRLRHGGRGRVQREAFVRWITDEVEELLR